MDTPIPKPMPPKRLTPKPIEEAKETTTAPLPKKVFVPKPHLTANPFRDSMEMRELQKNLHKKNPTKRSPRPNKKAQEKN